MIYTPHKNPTQTLILVSIISFTGIIGGVFISRLFMYAALIFWMQYTAILSYLQFKRQLKRRKKRRKKGTITEFLLNPQLRFFVFEFLAFTALLSILKYDFFIIGFMALIAWFGFSFNFYVYYAEFKKYE
ncbi:hypothetical protein ACFL0W_05360 [Nanoarchaeota archaeon]